jgi:hypothetical protein
MVKPVKPAAFGSCPESRAQVNDSTRAEIPRMHWQPLSVQHLPPSRSGCERIVWLVDPKYFNIAPSDLEAAIAGPSVRCWLSLCGLSSGHGPRPLGTGIAGLVAGALGVKAVKAVGIGAPRREEGWRPGPATVHLRMAKVRSRRSAS